MTTILRFALFFLLAPAFAIVAQAAGSVQVDFCVVGASFQTETVILDTVDGANCNYDASDALLQQRRSLDGKAVDEHDLESEAVGATEPLFSFLAEFVATNKIPIRQQYVDDIAGLRDLGVSARGAGQNAEATARMLHAERRALGVQYKNLTPKAELQRITERNIKKYNDPLGPSVDWLRSQGKSWDDIIESAGRAGGKDLGY